MINVSIKSEIAKIRKVFLFKNLSYWYCIMRFQFLSRPASPNLNFMLVFVHTVVAL